MFMFQALQVSLTACNISNSGALRPGSSSKIVNLVFNGNDSLDCFQIQHLDINSSKTTKFSLC